MKLYSENEEYKLYHGSMLDMLEVIQPNSIDSIITDPPYGLTTITKRFGKENSAECQYGKDGSFQRLSKGFMGKEWDGSGIEYNVEAWRKCYEVLKPGGYLLAFGGSRTFHRIACAIEDAGFEIRDTIMWLYGSGFPKSMNIGLAIDKRNGVESIDTGIQSSNARPNSDKTNTLYESGTVGKDFTIKKATNQWDGWGTCLKPAYEPIIVARKPVENSIIDNVIKYGVGGINIDECRVENCGEKILSNTNIQLKETKSNPENYRQKKMITELKDTGRFPANVILTYDDTDFEEVCGGMPDAKTGNIKPHKNQGNAIVNFMTNENITSSFTGDGGNASRYFYCAKASKFDRDEGLDIFTESKVNDGRKKSVDNAFQRGETPRKNVHPTVKPCELMRYLVRLVSPKGATILDCFNGSESTGKAVMLENKQYKKNYKYIGIELTEEYLPISKARIEYICNNEFSFTEDENGNQQHIVMPKGFKKESIFDILGEQ